MVAFFLSFLSGFFGTSEVDLPSSPSDSPLFLMERAEERVTKKPFGLYVTPSDSPVDLERFLGYHTGVDFEVFDDELDVDISIYAICEGEIRFVDWVSGYGGVLIQQCELNPDAPMTVLYGHLDVESIPHQVGDVLFVGDRLGVLGEGFTNETDGERKHLHLAIHRGKDLEFRGYVQDPKALDSWFDFLDLF